MIIKMLEIKNLKLTKYLIPLVFLVASILIMLSGRVLKKTYHGDEIPGMLDSIATNIKDEEWNEAIKATKVIKTRFTKITKLIQFSVERDQLEEFKLNLALLEGYLDTNDEKNAVATVYLLKQYWQELG